MLGWEGSDGQWAGLMRSFQAVCVGSNSVPVTDTKVIAFKGASYRPEDRDLGRASPDTTTDD